MTKQIEERLKVCAYKVRVHRKSYLSEKDMHCRENCSGLDRSCEDFLGLELDDNHYFVRRLKENGL